MKGTITDIQRFSLNDGPGIRTTVFFKGCNMRCAWCHNPETLSGRPQILYYPSKCIGCGACVAICPVGAQIIEGGVHRFDAARCTGCGLCASECFAGALVLSGRDVTVDEVMWEILQDKAYYEDSGGGVTLSGGEILCQTDFAMALVVACHANGIPVGVETNLHQPFERIGPLLRSVDLIMLDIKLFDDDAHRKWVGVTNARVLENVRQATALGVPVIVRTPLVPGITDTAENLEAIAAFVATLPNVVAYELLNFNPLGEAKYRALAMENVFSDARPLPPERLAQIGDRLRPHRLDVRIR